MGGQKQRSCPDGHSRCPEHEPGVRRFGRGALRIAAWTLVSRVLGLVRDRFMVGLFGRGMEFGAFSLAWTVPNVFRRLLGEGALTAAFVPVLTRRIDSEGIEGARRSFAAIVGGLTALLLIIVGGLLCLLGLIPVEWFASNAGGDERYPQLLRSLLFILLPYLIPVSLMTLSAAAQNVTGRFALPAAAPALLNAVWIAGVVWAGTGEADADQRVILVGIVVLCGGFLQLLLQLPGLVQSGLLVCPRLALADPDLREIVRTMAPIVLGLSVVQLNVLATQFLAAFLVDPGAPGVLYLGNRLLEFPHALLGVALGTAVFPLLTLLGSRDDHVELARILRRTLANGLFLAIPAAAGLFVMAPWLAEVLFVTGRFSAEAGSETTVVTRIMCLGLPGLIAVQLLARAFYAMGDLRTPVRIAVVLLVVVQGINIGLAPVLGTAGLACSSAVGANANALLLFFLLRPRLGPAEGGALAGTLLRSVLATVPTAIVALALVTWLGGMFPVGTSLALRLPLVLVVPGAAGVVTFLVTARLLGATELAELRRARK